MNLLNYFRISIILVALLLAFSTLQAQLDWSEYQSNPVLNGEAGAWDSGTLLSPTVIRSGDTLKMWYSGTTNIMDPGAIGIGYAHSVDGINWIKYSGNPVMTGRSGMWDNPGVGVPIVIQDGDTLRMWYAGGSLPDGTQIGYATSVDGVNWNRLSEPVMDLGQSGEWNSDILLPGSVIKENGVFKMWFTGGVGTIAVGNANTKTGIGYATSSDGINWTLHDDPATTTAPYQLSDPVLNHGDAGEWDANEMFTPSVLKKDSGYELWYSGWRFGGGGQHIGYATSADGTEWIKHPQNPIFLAANNWNPGLVFPSVILDGEHYRMWFQGWQFPSASIGYATAPVVTSIDGKSQMPNEFNLLQNYPNPFNPSTNIQYAISERHFVSLKIIDVLGNKVATLVHEEKPAGNYEVTFNATGLSSGVYFYKIQSGDYFETKKMLFLK